jgi:hypothetical protein
MWFLFPENCLSHFLFLSQEVGSALSSLTVESEVTASILLLSALIYSSNVFISMRATPPDDRRNKVVLMLIHAGLRQFGNEPF